MKTKNLLCCATLAVLCCATLAFVNQRIATTTLGGNRYGSSLFVRQKLQLRLLNFYEHTNNNCHGSESGRDGNLHENSQNNRRLFFQTTISKSFLASIMLLIPMNTKSAHAACMSGDIRTECIGVYKLPILDAADHPYVASPEKLKVYAPDLQWVPPVEYPPNYSDALNQLKDQRQQLDTAQELIAKGDMEKTGLVLLDIIPKVSAAGIVIIKSFGDASNKERNAAMEAKNKSSGDNNDGNPSSATTTANKATALEMKSYRIEYTLSELLGYLAETDILIGQGLRGELGVSAPAQIEILSQLADCRKEFDNLLGTVPEKLPSL